MSKRVPGSLKKKNKNKGRNQPQRGRSLVVSQHSLIVTSCILDFFFSAEIDSPTHLVTDQVTEDTVTISWDRVLALIDKYVVNYTSADGDTEEIEVGKNKTATTLVGLKPGTEYVIYLWAEKGVRQSKRTSTEAVTGILEESLWFCPML